MGETDWRHIALLALSWLGYFVTHSLLASLWLKKLFAASFPLKMRIYRLGFNAVALVTLLPILWLSFHDPGPALWVWSGPAAWLANGLALAAIGGFVASLKHYDTQEFFGLRQWRSHSRRVEDQEGFHLSPFHRYVRHPWYFFSLVLLWTRDMNSATLLSVLMMTIYFVIGSRLEEKKLQVYHGEIYRRYMKSVPGLIPLPWKMLSADEAARLVKAAKADNLP